MARSTQPNVPLLSGADSWAVVDFYGEPVTRFLTALHVDMPFLESHN